MLVMYLWLILWSISVVLAEEHGHPTSVVFALEDAYQNLHSALSKTFLDGLNDFQPPSQNRIFFPFKKAVNDSNKISFDLEDWRGFVPVENLAVGTDLNNMFKQISSLDVYFKNRGMSHSEIEKLPKCWQYLLPKVFYEGLELTGAHWAKMTNNDQSNAAFLLKIATLLRDKPSSTKYRFIDDANVPDFLKYDLGTIVGYRWGVIKQEDHVFVSNYLKMSTNFLLPTDIVMGIDRDVYKEMKLTDRLEDTQSWWGKANENARALWFYKFDKMEPIQFSGNQTKGSVKMYLHLLAGAPLEKIRKVISNYFVEKNGEIMGADSTDMKFIMDVANKTVVNPLRVQELWEVLETRWINLFVGVGNKLDVSQIIAYDERLTKYPENQKELLDMDWLSSSTTDVPWVNILAVGILNVDNLIDTESGPEFKIMGKEDLYKLGKFLVLLYPKELEAISAVYFDDDLFDHILSPLLTHCQRTVLYRSSRRSSASSLHPLLFPAIPSDVLLKLGSESSHHHKLSWTNNYAELIEASKLYVPGQMHALHSIAKKYFWQKEYLSEILQTHPQCLADVLPMEFRSNLQNVVDAINEAGPTKSRHIANSIQSLPARLLTAWLEAVHEMESSTTENGVWKTDVLLDRFDVGTDDRSRISFLPSLALAGISCHCIKMIETPDALEILGLYRFSLQSRGVLSRMPSAARWCWTKKIRKFLALKAKLFNVTVKEEIELLSLLSTSDIRAIGGEILLTWGAAPLTGIRHPQVQHEVLMTVGTARPLDYMHSSCQVKDMEGLSKTLLEDLLKDTKTINLKVLTHLHNLVPFADDRIVESSSENVRLYVSTVLRKEDKSICLPVRHRMDMAKFLITGFGEPESWSALDLVEMGDLMVVFKKHELLRVSPTSLRRAASQLVANSLYSEYLNGRGEKVLYHEACSAWLEGMGGSEGTEFTKAWRGLAEFYILGNHLQVGLLETWVEKNLDLPGPPQHTRRKRQGTENLPVRDVYLKFIADMKAKFSNSTDVPEDEWLSEEQKGQASQIIHDAQTLLSEYSLKALGVNTSIENNNHALDIIQSREKNMTKEQTEKMTVLAEETQVRVMQGLAKVFGYTDRDISTKYGVPLERVQRIMNRQTFTNEPPTRERNSTVIDPRLVNPLDYTWTGNNTDNSSATGRNSDIVENNLDKELKEIDSLTNTTDPLGDKSISVFKRYEPNDGPLSLQFKDLPRLSEVSLSCHCVKASGATASAMSIEHISAMEPKEVEKCLDTFGKLPWPKTSLQDVWTALQDKIPKFKKEGGVILDRDQMLLLENILPAVAKSTPNLIGVERGYIDGLSLLGRQSLPKSYASRIIQRFLDENKISENPLTSTEVASLGHLLCGLHADQWPQLITREIFRSVLVEHLSLLDCSVPDTVRTHLEKMLIEINGPTKDWTTSDLKSVGWVASALNSSHLASLPANIMEGFSSNALKHLGGNRILDFSAEQLAELDPSTARFIKAEQLEPYTPLLKRRAIRSVAGESAALMALMEKLEPRMSDQDEVDKDNNHADDASARQGKAVNKGIFVSGNFLILIIVSVFIRIA